jgi:tetratricopeptide (TPR) repeat protein
MIGFVVLIAALIVIGWLVAYMRAQKPVSAAHPLNRAEELKLAGRFEEAIDVYRRTDDPVSKEGIALCLAHLGRDLDEAKRLMEEMIATHPQIQEFQALGLAYILLKRGERDAALRLYEDNLVLLETRFRDDYTDPDPLLAETLVMYATLAAASGDAARAAALRRQAAEWAPGSVWSGV